MSVIADEIFKVGDWLVEPDLLRISKNGEVRKLEFRTMEVLLCFVANQGEVVSKQKLHDEVWGEVFVTDNALTRSVSKLRKALDDDPHQPRYIDTISKSGYRLLVPVEFKKNTSVEAFLDVLQKIFSNRHWLLGVFTVLVLSGLILGTISSGNDYNAFFDPIPVSTLIGPELAPSISPDGEKLSFTYAQPGTGNPDVYIKLLDDLSQVKFTDHNTPQGFSVWSPDGNYIAYASAEEGTCGIYKEPSFGGEKIRIGDCFQKPEDFVWSPDGKTIAFTDIKSPKENRNIFFLNVETQIAEELTVLDSNMSDRDPAFSPDGKHLIFRRLISGQGNDVYKMNLANKELTRLTFENTRIIGLDVFDNGKQIAFSSDKGGTWALWKVPLKGGLITRFYINDRVPTDPKFSANGNRMVYRSIRDQIRLWSFEKERSEYNSPKAVASSTRAEMHPSLSRDGQKMVFISNRSGSYEIWTVNFEDNNPVKLTSLEGSFINMPSWSPDGKDVIFDSRIGGDNAIYIIDVASKMMRTFVDLEGDQVNARYSKDGRKIYFGSNHSGTWQIWEKPVFGKDSDIEQVTFNGGYYLQEGPQDDRLYYSKFDTSGIWVAEKGKPEKLFIPQLSDFDWGNWAPINEGILYVNRDSSAQVCLHNYGRNGSSIPLFTPAKRIQLWSPSLTATLDGDKIIVAQIENSEDEIMMVDFK